MAATETRKRTATGRKPVTNLTYYRTNKRRAARFRWGLQLLFFLACLASGYFFSFSPFFHISEITVTGNNKVSSADIIHASGILSGQNIFSVSPNFSAVWISMDYSIESVQLVKSYPDKITIAVTERTPVALVPFVNGFLEVDRFGVVLSRVRHISSINLPLLSGVGGIEPGIIPGMKITGKEISEGLSMILQLPEEAVSFIAEINVLNVQKIVIYSQTGTEVRIGDSSFFLAKYDLAQKILDDQQKNGRLSAVKYLDVGVLDSPVILYSN